MASARAQAQQWASTVQAYAQRTGARYEPTGGINALGAPAALCVGGTNRLTGQLSGDFWGTACDALEEETGGWMRSARLPHGGLAKAHVPDVAAVLPPFACERADGGADDLMRRHATRHRVEFESLDFNHRYLVTVPAEYDPIAIRELFSPAMLDWAATVATSVDFGVLEGQMWVLWRYATLDADGLQTGLKSAAEVFARVRRELTESGYDLYGPGPWHAGLEPFPPGGSRAAEGTSPGPPGTPAPPLPGLRHGEPGTTQP